MASSFSEHELMRVVVTLWRTGFIDALTAKLCGGRELLEVSLFAQLQVCSGSKVTSALHDSCRLSTDETLVLQLLKAPMPRESLANALATNIGAEEAHGVIERLREKGFFL
jgi:hypothetical protein